MPGWRKNFCRSNSENSKKHPSINLQHPENNQPPNFNMKLRILLMPDTQTGAESGQPETDAAKLKRLTAELAAANRRLAACEAADQERAATEKQVAAKMAIGLSREQALAVIERQKQYDQAKAESVKANSGNAK
jgi:hypothetical protein